MHGEGRVGAFSMFQVETLCKRNIRIVTMHVCNPYVGNEAVAMFLGRYRKVDKPVSYLRDSYGIWSGLRQFRVQQGDDLDSSDGLQHPPAYVSIGVDRVFLFYSGQPRFCRQGFIFSSDVQVFGHFCVTSVVIRSQSEAILETELQSGGGGGFWKMFYFSL